MNFPFKHSDKSQTGTSDPSVIFGVNSSPQIRLWVKLGVVVSIALILGGAAFLVWRPKDAGYSSQAKDQTIPGAQVSITDSSFVPATLKVKPGQSVTWVNQSSQPHQVTEDPYTAPAAPHGLDSQDPLLQGEAYTFTFDEPGTYTYHDHLNPLVTGFKGIIIVEK